MAGRTVTEILFAFLQQYGLLGRELLVGFSGGVDSTALVLALQCLEQSFTAVHFQHGLRAEAALADERWCREFCCDRGLRYQCQSLRVPERRQAGESFEEAARRLRLEAWLPLSDSGRLAVLLAHHADDCLEDLLLKLAHGANVSGLSGLREYRQLGRLQLYRPFLTCRKSTLREYVQGQGVQGWCLDATNLDNSYRRNAVRNLILPQFCQTFAGDSGLQRALAVLRQDAEYLEEQATAALGKITSLESWQALPGALLPRVLRLWLEREFGSAAAPSGKLVRRLQVALQKFSGKSTLLPLWGEEKILLERAGLQKYTPAAGILARAWAWQSQPRLTLPECQASLYICDPADIPPGLPAELFDRAELPAVLRVRAWQPGDSLQPFGASFQQKIQDIFTDARIPRSRRGSIPVLLAGETIIWLPGVRRAEFARTKAGRASLAIVFTRP